MKGKESAISTANKTTGKVSPESSKITIPDKVCSYYNISC